MDQVNQPSLRPLVAAFSLVELLVVMGITSLLLALAGLGVSKVVPAMELSRGGQTVSDTIALARQEASTLNREIQVVFVELPDGPDKYWSAMQLWRVDETADGQLVKPITALLKLPASVAITPEPELSPLLVADPSLEGSANFGGQPNVRYRGFRFRAGGLPDQSVKAGTNFVTVRRRSDAAAVPQNYYTVQINPITGRTFIYRP